MTNRLMVFWRWIRRSGYRARRRVLEQTVGDNHPWFGVAIRLHN